MPSAVSRAKLDVVDWLMLTLSLLGAFTLVAGYLVWVPDFAKMFRDFGAGAEPLPLLTRAALSPWLACGAAGAVLVLCTLWVLARRAGRRGLALLVTAFVLACAAALTVVILALYAPIFQLAGNIKQ